MGDPMHFFMPMVPPTATKQEKQVRVVRDKKTGKHKPVFHPSDAWEAAEAKLRAHLEAHRPSKPLEGAVILAVVWCFPAEGHADGEPYTETPDVDNCSKGFLDIMTDLGWWKDDKIVFDEHITKIYSRIPGIRVDIEELHGY